MVLHRGDASLFWVHFEFHEDFLGHQGMGLSHTGRKYLSIRPRLEHLCRRNCCCLLCSWSPPRGGPGLGFGRSCLWVSWEVKSEEARSEGHVVTMNPQAGSQGPSPGPRQAICTPHFFHYHRMTAAHFEGGKKKDWKSQVSVFTNT